MLQVSREGIRRQKKTVLSDRPFSLFDSEDLDVRAREVLQKPRQVHGVDGSVAVCVERKLVDFNVGSREVLDESDEVKTVRDAVAVDVARYVGDLRDRDIFLGSAHRADAMLETFAIRRRLGNDLALVPLVARRVDVVILIIVSAYRADVGGITRFRAGRFGHGRFVFMTGSVFRNDIAGDRQAEGNLA